MEAIAARAAAAPDGYWVAMPDGIWIPWAAPDDTDPATAWDHGRYIGIHDGDWHGTTEPPAALWAFLAAARDDVLTLAAEVGHSQITNAVKALRSDIDLRIAQIPGVIDLCCCRSDGLLHHEALWLKVVLTGCVEIRANPRTDPGPAHNRQQSRQAPTFKGDNP